MFFVAIWIWICPLTYWNSNACSIMTDWIHVGLLWSKSETIYLPKKACLIIIHRNTTHILDMSYHCVKSVQIRSYFWSLTSCILTEYLKIRTRNNSVFGHFSHSAMFISVSNKSIITKILKNVFSYTICVLIYFFLYSNYVWTFYHTLPISTYMDRP